MLPAATHGEYNSQAATLRCRHCRRCLRLLCCEQLLNTNKQPKSPDGTAHPKATNLLVLVDHLSRQEDVLYIDLSQKLHTVTCLDNYDKPGDRCSRSGPVATQVKPYYR